MKYLKISDLREITELDDLLDEDNFDEKEVRIYEPNIDRDWDYIEPNMEEINDRYKPN